jgi:hypothetical protein
MYFEEKQIVDAHQYLMECKQKTQTISYYTCMPSYFEQEGVYGITLRAEYKDFNDTFHLFITPPFECFRYPLLVPDYEKILGSGFVVDKIKELFGDTKYVLKVDNQDKNTGEKIYSGPVLEGFIESVEEKCFYYIV